MGIILLSSSLPIQASQIFIKCGFLLLTVEGISHGVCSGFMSICLQSKEFLYPYYPLSDATIGGISHFTTGLHGTHVILGCFG